MENKKVTVGQKEKDRLMYLPNTSGSECRLLVLDLTEDDVNTEKIIDILHESQYFSTIDLGRFYQVELKDNSISMHPESVGCSPRTTNCVISNKYVPRNNLIETRL